MENLFIENENGKKRIEPKIIEKYKLEKGIISPFTRNHVTNARGEFPDEASVEKNPKNSGGNRMKEDPQTVVLTQSETLDFAQATDSPTGN